MWWTLPLALARAPDLPAQDDPWWTRKPVCPAGAVLSGSLQEGRYQCMARGVAHGRETELHDGTARKHWERVWVRGRLEGPWVEWYEDGTKRFEHPCKDDEAHGLWRDWDEQGRLRSEATYDRGRLNGRQVDYDALGRIERVRVYADDALVEETVYLEGVVQSQARWKDDVLFEATEVRPAAPRQPDEERGPAREDWEPEDD